MATIPQTTKPGGSSLAAIMWSPLAGSDVGQPYSTERSGPLGGAVQFSGALDDVVQLEGSIDGVTYFTIKDVTGAPISTAAAAIFEFSTACIYIRPVAASLVTAATVTIALRG